MTFPPDCKVTIVNELYSAIENGCIDEVKKISERYKNEVAECFLDSNKALILAAGKGYVEITKIILSQDVFFNYTSAFIESGVCGSSAIYSAIKNNHEDVVSLLCSNDNANIFAPCCENTDRSKECAKQCMDVLKYILSMKDNKLDNDVYSKLLLDCVTNNGPIEAFKALLKDGRADVNYTWFGRYYSLDLFTTVIARKYYIMLRLLIDDGRVHLYDFMYSNIRDKETARIILSSKNIVEELSCVIKCREKWEILSERLVKRARKNP